MIDNLLKLYRSMLTVGSLDADKEGFISVTIDGASVPFVVEGKRMVLPTMEHQRNPDKSGIVLFHPLNENLLHGESKIMERFRYAANVRLNFVIGAITSELLKLSVDVAAHKRFNPDQAAILTALKDADEKTLNVFLSLLKAMGHGNSEKCFVHIFLKRGGVVRGTKYNKACIVSFPLYEELLKDDKQVYGVTMSKKQKAVIRALLESIFPKIAEPSGYDYGSLSDLAPVTDALMQAVLRLAMPINDTLAVYEDLIPNAETLKYDDEWVEPFQNLGGLIKEIKFVPMQEGNEGVSMRAANQPAPAGQLQNVNPAAPVGYQPQPTQPHAMAPAASAPATSPGVVKTASGGIDMNATLANNPQLAQAMGMAGGMALYPGSYVAPPPGPQTARQGEPRWARPGPTMAHPQGGYTPGYYGGPSAASLV